MSLRAELLRLALRAFKGGGKPDTSAIRRNMKLFQRITPHPPKRTQVAKLRANGVPALQIQTPHSRKDCHVLYLHGGGYVFGSPSLYRDFTWRIADATAARVLCIDYRLAPEHPFPAAVDDAVAAYRWLLAEGAEPGRIAIMGDSAGGGLTFGAMLRLRDEGVPLPAAAAGLSAWTDLALTGDTFRSNCKADPMINVGQTAVLADLYLAGADPRHPYASPLHGDLRGLPPSLLQVGSDEVLHDDAEIMVRRLREAGCRADLEVWPRMPHVWHLFARVLPEGRQAIARIGEFVRGAFAAS